MGHRALYRPRTRASSSRGFSWRFDSPTMRHQSPMRRPNAGWAGILLALVSAWLSGQWPSVRAAIPVALEVKRYDVVGNSLLDPPAVSAVFTNAIGPAIPM